MTTKFSNYIPTCDKTIRNAFKQRLICSFGDDSATKIIEELGLTHGAARIDIAVLDGIIHGYEFKSDLDNLLRLPGQMKIYNAVLDRITLVVGKNHLFNAINIIPDWWGIIIAKRSSNDQDISFCLIREAEDNPLKNSTDIASLLWREEALELLQKYNLINGLRSQPRHVLYEKLASKLDQDTLRAKVREYLFTRRGWRSG